MTQPAASRIITDLDGRLIGIFGDGAVPPEGAIEVTALPDETLDAAKAEALAYVQELYVAFVSAATGNRPSIELDTWSRQFEWAAKFLEDGDVYSGERLAGTYSDAKRADLISRGKDPATQQANFTMGFVAMLDVIIELGGKMKNSGQEEIAAATTVPEVHAAVNSIRGAQQGYYVELQNRLAAL